VIQNTGRRVEYIVVFESLYTSLTEGAKATGRILPVNGNCPVLTVHVRSHRCGAKQRNASGVNGPLQLQFVMFSPVLKRERMSSDRYDRSHVLWLVIALLQVVTPRVQVTLEASENRRRWPGVLDRRRLQRYSVCCYCCPSTGA